MRLCCRKIVSPVGCASKVAPTTTGKLFAKAGYAFSGIGLLIDGVTIAASIYSLGKGSTTSASEILREEIAEMQKEINNVDKMYRDTSKPGPWTMDWTVDWTMDRTLLGLYFVFAMYTYGFVCC